MKKIMMILICMTATFMLYGCGDKSTSTPASASNSTEEPAEEETTYLTGLHHVEIEIENYGIISLELDADVAPITVTNFISLAQSRFYDGTTFHRIINGFMMQGGAPKAGYSTSTIKGEFASNGVENSILHERGVISMARSKGKDSASSQFFIVQGNAHHLDGDYAAFGHVTEGMEIVDQICEEAIVEEDKETVLKENQPVITTIRVID